MNNDWHVILTLIIGLIFGIITGWKMRGIVENK
jgi:hypothetical protein